MLKHFLFITLAFFTFAARAQVHIPVAPEKGYRIDHTVYSLSLNRKTNCPDWVAWKLTAKMARTKVASRDNYSFVGDTAVIKSHRVTTDDYRNSGYDRGHMCPAADCRYSEKAMRESFFMSNICPQNPTLNREWWEHTENACRRWAEKEKTLYIVCGPVYFNKDNPVIGNNMFVTVPDGFYKVVLSLRKGHEKAIGFFYKNTGERQTMESAVRTVDDIEKTTGIDFFPSLDDELEKKLESRSCLCEWD